MYDSLSSQPRNDCLIWSLIAIPLCAYRRIPTAFRLRTASAAVSACDAYSSARNSGSLVQLGRRHWPCEAITNPCSWNRTFDVPQRARPESNYDKGEQSGAVRRQAQLNLMRYLKRKLGPALRSCRYLNESSIFRRMPTRKASLRRCIALNKFSQRRYFLLITVYGALIMQPSVINDRNDPLGSSINLKTDFSVYSAHENTS